MQSLLILGRQPALGLAELESLYGAAALQSVGDIHGATAGALLDISAEDIDFSRLGGSLKLARVLTTLDSTNWGDIEKYLVQSTPKHAAYLPEGKMQLGISAYGLQVNPQRLMATGLTLKKVIKSTGRSVRLVPNKEPELNSASVLHNNLTGPTGWELLFLRDGQRVIVAQTTAVQDIDAYAARDQGRPMRDARVGMLPPKLAQIIINLATPNLSPSPAATILDPFCGTGVILQEALLMGYSVYGTDLEPRMVEYTQKNIEWLQNQFTLQADAFHTTVDFGDATLHEWKQGMSAVACETYLGRPFSTLPDSETLNQTISDCNLIIKRFLQNLQPQLQPNARLCLAVPAWQVRPGQFKHLGLIDSLGDMGYNRISFEHVRAEDLLYYRADQVVARELLVLEKR